MADFTIELRDVCARYSDAELGLEAYPIFDEAYRPHLNKLIKDHYWFRETAYETVAMFAQQLRHRLELVMPYYNRLYESTRIEFDPLSTMDVSSVSDGTHASSSSNEGSGTTENRTSGAAESDARDMRYPDTAINQHGDYAVSGNKSNGRTEGASKTDNTSKSSAKGDETTHATSHSTGRSQSASSLIVEYRASLINVDRMVLGELADLFFGLWTSNDNYIGGDMYTGFGAMWGWGYWI
nr:MAG TPA: Lower collar protein [Caudoviricetes sp.]